MKFLSNIRLGNKLRWATACMVAMLMAIVAVSLGTMGHIRSTEESAQVQALRTSMAQNVHTRVVTSVMHIGSLLVHEQGFGADGGRKARSCQVCHENRATTRLTGPIEHETEEYTAELRDLVAGAANDQDRKLLATVEQASSAVRTANTQVIGLWKQGKMQEAWSQYCFETRPAVAVLDAEIAKLVASRQAEGEALVRATGTAMTWVRWILIGLGILVALISIPAAAILARDVTRPVAAVIEHLGRVAKGDVSTDVRPELMGRRDEAGDLATATQQVIGSLRPIIQKVAGGVQTLSASSTELSAVSGGMSEGSRKTSERVEAVTKAAEEMSSTMMGLASGMEQASNNLMAVASATEQMTATIGEIAANSEKARRITAEATQQAGSVSELMNDLGKAAQRIGEVTETISNISAQTNLLALNATIEAARAGAAGKGFAVVANEIKELASQTAAATEDIKSRVGGIQSSTAATITDIGGISKTVREVSEIVSSIATAIEEQAAVTKDIAGNIAQASAGVKTAAVQVTRNSNVSTQMAADIETVNRAAGEAANGSTQVQCGAEELSRLAEQLRQSVEQFVI
jgi:methyl-accepting chemotaxis protein